MRATRTPRVRPAAVAGAFYPAGIDRLRAAIGAAFAAACQPDPGAAVPKALVVPHAGYQYSGPVAASAYLRLVPGRHTIRRVVLIGPSHRVALRGVAVSGAEAFRTPLGDVPVDREGCERALRVPVVVVDEAAHSEEHSLEVQLPFLQTVLEEFSVVPMVAGWATDQDVADALEAVWGGEETVVVVSTDLSHYHPYEEARALDTRTAAAVVAGQVGSIGDRDACGAGGLRGLLTVATERSMPIELLDLRNSGDTAGDPGRVVGYGSFAVC